MARFPERNAPASPRQEPAPLHPFEPALQALSGAVRPPGAMRPGSVRVHALGEEPEHLRPVLQGLEDPRGDVPRCRRATRRCAGRRSSCRCSSRTSAARASSHEQCPTFEFTQLMDRFYRMSMDVLVEHDAIVEKFVGDEVVGLVPPVPRRSRPCGARRRCRRRVDGRGRVRVGRRPVAAARGRGPHGTGLRRHRREPGRAGFHRPRRSDEHRSASRLQGRCGRDPASRGRWSIACPRSRARASTIAMESLKGYAVDAFVLQPPATAAAG